MQVHHELGLRSPSVVQAAEVLLSSTLSSEANMSSDSYTAYDPGQNTTQWNSHMTSEHPDFLWPTPSDRQPLFPLVDQGSATFWHPFHGQPSVRPYPPSLHSHHPRSSNDNNVQEPSITLHSPPYQLFSPAPPHFSPPLTSPRLLGSDPQLHLAFYRVPRSGFPGSLRRRRGAARAIEYEGLWIDEEELLKSLTEPDGKLIAHPCLWEDDHSPCHLWIKGDRSCINAHIQKWHGEKPGGEKSKVHCRWSGCGKRMLKESIARHVLSVHLGEVWECQGCGKDIVRNDAYGQHAAKSNLEACGTAGALVTCSADARVIDTRAALSSGGRVRSARA